MELKFSELSNFQEKQKVAESTLFKPECKYLLYGGAVGGGKSYWLRWTALELVLYYTSKYDRDDIIVGLFSEDYPTLKDRQISRIKMEFPDWLGTLKTTQTDGLAYYVNPQFGGGKILLRNLDDPSKYASSEFCAIGVEELTKNSRDTFDSLRHRLRFPGIIDTKFFAATNPGEIGHAFVKSLWVTQDAQDIEQDSFFYVPASYRDNQYIDTDSYEKQLMGLPLEMRRALMEGDWDIIAGAAFPELRREVHVVKPFKLPTGTRYFAGYDHGYNHPFSFVLFAVVPDGAVYVTNYVTGRLMRPDEIVKKIKERTFGKTPVDIYAGTDIWSKQRSGAPSVVDQFRDNGFTKSEGYNVIKAKMDRIQGAHEIRKWIAHENIKGEQPALFFFENTLEIYETVARMQFDTTKPEDVMKVDADLNGIGGDDHYDAFRYGIMSRMKPARPKKDLYPTNSAQYLIEKHIEAKQRARRLSSW